MSNYFHLGCEYLPAYSLDSSAFELLSDEKTNVQTSDTFTHDLANGYTMELTGWTHTRDYAKGYLRNKAGNGLATVSGLQPNRVYHYDVYQYAQGDYNSKYIKRIINYR